MADALIHSLFDELEKISSALQFVRRNPVVTGLGLAALGTGGAALYDKAKSGYQGEEMARDMQSIPDQLGTVNAREYLKDSPHQLLVGPGEYQGFKELLLKKYPHDRIQKMFPEYEDLMGGGPAVAMGFSAGGPGIILSREEQTPQVMLDHELGHLEYAKQQAGREDPDTDDRSFWNTMSNAYYKRNIGAEEAGAWANTPDSPDKVFAKGIADKSYDSAFHHRRSGVLGAAAAGFGLGAAGLYGLKRLIRA